MREIDVFETLGGDVLTLRELEDVFPAIDDLEAAARIDGRYIAGAEPAVGEHGFLRFFFVAVVAIKETGAAD